MNDFDYPLPKELIAQSPLPKRDASRLLVADRKKGSLTDRHFFDLLEYLPAGDVLVSNDTKVFPARILGRKKKTEGKVDLLLLSPVSETTWKCLVQPSMKEGQELFFPPENGEAVFLKRDADGIPLFEFKGVDNIRALASKIGTMPLPPYIKREAGASDMENYQTVFAAKEGAVAAPTAGLHFTKNLLENIRAKGVKVLTLTLHVGYGTFKPVEDLEHHQMHAEYFEISEEIARQINQAKVEKRGIWAVGTTTLRALETCVQKKILTAGSGYTDLFIRAPFDFEVVDHLVTNFHLPKTTLLFLVSAFMGEPFRKQAYDHAIASRYRFYSYGDAMLIR